MEMVTPFLLQIQKTGILIIDKMDQIQMVMGLDMPPLPVLGLDMPPVPRISRTWGRRMTENI